MDSIVVFKHDLLDKLRENRVKHEATYKEASVAYRLKVIEALTEKLADVQAGKDFSLYIELPKPKSFTDSYDEAIAMLEWEQSDTITLTQSDFKQYVLDQWGWTNTFAASSLSYTSS